jgi:lipid II:glycine glycyltransferase (peptidoglycan interpeptide bridge formation enzyme)
MTASLVQYETHGYLIDSHIIRVQVSKELEDAQWDLFLATVAQAHYAQSSLWARCKALLGYRVVRIVMVRDDRIVGGAQMLIRPSALAGDFGFVPFGPVLAPDSLDLSVSILDQLRVIACKEHLRYLAVQPQSDKADITCTLHAQRFQLAPIDIAPSASICINLSSDSGSLLRGMHRHTRRHILGSKESGLVVREGGRSDLKLSYELMVLTGKRHGYSPYLLEYFTQLWDILAPAGCIKLFLAEVEGEAVTALFLIAFGDTVTAWKSGWSGLHPRCYPNEAIYWSAIQWAASCGYRFLDLGGLDREIALKLKVFGGKATADSRYQGAHFKIGFGGEIVLGSRAFAYLPNPLLRLVHRALPKDLSHSHALVPALNWALSRLR